MCNYFMVEMKRTHTYLLRKAAPGSSWHCLLQESSLQRFAVVGRAKQRSKQRERAQAS